MVSLLQWEPLGKQLVSSAANSVSSEKTRWVRFGTQTIARKELTDFSPRDSVRANKLTELGVWNRALRNSARPVSEQWWTKGNSTLQRIVFLPRRVLYRRTWTCGSPKLHLIVGLNAWLQSYGCICPLLLRTPLTNLCEFSLYHGRPNQGGNHFWIHLAMPPAFHVGYPWMPNRSKDKKNKRMHVLSDERSQFCNAERVISKWDWEQLWHVS